MTGTVASAEKGSGQHSGFWARLQEQVSLADYCPRPAEGVVARQQDDHYVLKTAQSDSYLRLSLDEHTLWTWMDGRRSVRQLAVDFFLRQQRLLPVAELVQRLRAGRFLADPPTGLRDQLQGALRRQEEPWGRRLLELLWGHPLSIKGVDRFFRVLYRLGGRLFFARSTLFLQGLIALVGFIAFVFLLVQGRQGYEVFQAGRSYLLGFLLLLLLNVATLSLHECAHALATIHEGCEIRRGGFLLYLGLPTLFVDTTDTWMVGKKGRIRVAAAGPWNDLVLGGLCALLALPLWGGGPILLKVATLAYVSALFNLNPLAEVDGYYVLIDTLELPHLRRDALAFVGGELWPRRRQRQPLSSRERLYAIYGLLAAAYLVLLAGLVFLFWRTQVSRLVVDLLRWGLGGWIILGILAALVGLPLLWLVGKRLYLVGRRAWRSLAERGFLGRAAVRLMLVAGVSILLAFLLLLLPASRPGVLLYFSLLLFYALAVGALFAVVPLYRGTRFQFVLVGLGVILGIRGLMIGWDGASRVAVLLSQVIALVTALIAFSARDLVRSRPAERVSMGLFLGGGAILALYLAQRTTPGGPFLVVVGESGPAFLGGLALAMLVPTVVSFAGTPFAPSWVLFFLALTLNLVRSAAVADLPLALELDLTAAWLMAQGATLYLLTHRHLPYRTKEWDRETAWGAHARLRGGFARFFTALFGVFCDTFGRRRAQILDDRMDIIAVTADWPIAVDAGCIQEVAEVEDWPLEQLAARYGEFLESAVDIMDDLAGQPFLRRAIQSAYDGLPWAERAVLARHVFSKTAWGEAVSEDLSLQQAELSLLAGVPLFWGFDEEMLAELRAALRQERVQAGQVIARSGRTGTDLWIVVSGEVEVWEADESGREHLVDELHRGDLFGEEALLGESYPAMYQASVDTVLLCLEGAVLGGLWKGRPQPSAQVRDRARLFSWLASLDLFQGLPWRDMQALAARLEQRHVPAWETVIQEGRPANAFYLIEEGKALAVVGWATEREEIRGELGPGEYLSEIAPLLGGDSAVTVLTTEPSTLWALPAKEFQAFWEKSLVGG